MPQTGFNLRSLTGDAELVAAIAPASEAFGLFNRVLDLPPYWAALVSTDHGEARLFSAGSEVDGQGAEEVMLVRTNPLALHYEFNRLASDDGYPCDLDLTLQVQVIAELSELAAFRSRLLGSKRSVGLGDLHTEFQEAVHEGVRRFVKSQATPALLNDLNSSELYKAIQVTLKPVLFQVGMSLDSLQGIVVRSASYRQAEQERIGIERQKARQGARAELQRAVEQSQGRQATHLAELLTRLKSLADDSPAADLQELIATFEESQRGSMYEALWAGATAEVSTRWLVAVSGSELLYFDGSDLARSARRVAVESEVGPMRSICHCHSADGSQVLLAGAATGVLILDADSGQVRQSYAAEVGSGRQVRGGFNSVALAGDCVLGAHSELGLWRWSVGKPESASPIFASRTKSAHTVRHVQFVGGRLYFSIDAQAFSLPADFDEQAAVIYQGHTDVITALVCTGEHLYAGDAVGKIVRWCINSPGEAESLNGGRGRAVESIAYLQSGGVARLLFTDTSTAVHARVIGDAFACRYEAGGQTIRRAEFAADWIVGTHETRDRLFCWPVGQASCPPTVVPVAQLSGHSIQDVCLVPGTVI